MHIDCSNNTIFDLDPLNAKKIGFAQDSYQYQAMTGFGRNAVLPVNQLLGFNGQGVPPGYNQAMAPNMPGGSAYGGMPTYVNNGGFWQLPQQQYASVYTPVYFMQPNGYPARTPQQVMREDQESQTPPAPENNQPIIINNYYNKTSAWADYWNSIEPIYKQVGAALLLMIGTALLLKHTKKE